MLHLDTIVVVFVSDVVAVVVVVSDVTAVVGVVVVQRTQQKNTLNEK